MTNLDTVLDLKILVNNKFVIITLGLYYLLFSAICNATQDLEQNSIDTNSEEIFTAPLTPPRDYNSPASLPRTPDAVQNQIVSPDMMRYDLPKKYFNIMNFQHGDLIYGLEGARRDTREYLLRKTGLKIITADHYNNFFLGLNDSILSPEFNLERLFQGSKLSFSPQEEDLIKNYAQFLRNSGLEENLLTSLKEFPDFPNFKRKSCKLAISFAKSKGSRIHFILDSIVMVNVVPKSEEFKEMYTSSELRFLYRQYLRSESNISHVIFYHKGEQVLPPWKQQGGPEYWRDNYHPEFMKKLARQGIGVKRKSSEVIGSSSKEERITDDY